MAQAQTLPRPLDGLRQSAALARRRAAALWHAHPREILGAGVFGLLGAAVLTTTALSIGSQATDGIAPPAPPPMTVRPLAPEQALKLNAEIPLTKGPNPAAAPFVFKGNAVSRTQALNCLTSAVYYEAGNQDEDGE